MEFFHLLNEFKMLFGEVELFDFFFIVVGCDHMFSYFLQFLDDDAIHQLMEFIVRMVEILEQREVVVVFAVVQSGKQKVKLDLFRERLDF